MKVSTRDACAQAGRATRRLACALIAATLITGGAFAQVDPATAVEAEAEQAPFYTVELIIFRYDESVPAGNEVFAPPEPPGDFVPEFSDETFQREPGTDEPVAYGDQRQAGGLGQPSTTEAPRGADSAGVAAFPGNPLDPQVLDDRLPARQRIELRLLDAQEPRMNDIHRKLARLDAYHPIMRAAWTQATPARDQAPALHVQSLGVAPEGLDGSVTLYVGRFVHLVLDLELDAAGASGAAAATDRLAGGDENRLQDGYGVSGRPFRQPVRYRISENRIMRNGDIRYFDHPKFGVIARVTKAEHPDENDEPDTQDAVADSD